MVTSNVFVEDAARNHEAKIGKAIRYVITLKSGQRFYTAFDGGIIFDGVRKMGFGGEKSWAIIGFTPHWNSRNVIPLAEAAGGEDFGAGYIVDTDHGTIRQWGSPKDHRAVKVEMIDALTEEEAATLAARRAAKESADRVHSYAVFTLQARTAQEEAAQATARIAALEPLLTPAEREEADRYVTEVEAAARKVRG